MTSKKISRNIAFVKVCQIRIELRSGFNLSALGGWD